MIPLLLLPLSWSPVTLDCRGLPEPLPVTYLVTYRWGFMHYSPDCPLDADGKPQACSAWSTYTVPTNAPSATLPDPGLGEVIAYNQDWIVAVDAAGNQSCPAP